MRPPSGDELREPRGLASATAADYTESLQLYPRVQRVVRTTAETTSEELGDAPRAPRAGPRREPDTDSDCVTGGAELSGESRCVVGGVDGRVIGAAVPDQVQRSAPVDAKRVDERIEAAAVRPRIVRVASKYQPASASDSGHVVGPCAGYRPL